MFVFGRNQNYFSLENIFVLHSEISDFFSVWLRNALNCRHFCLRTIVLNAVCQNIDIFMKYNFSDTC